MIRYMLSRFCVIRYFNHTEFMQGARISLCVIRVCVNRVCVKGFHCKCWSISCMQVLGIYTYTKCAPMEEFDTKARKSQGFSTVSHFNIVHYDCHVAAVRWVFDYVCVGWWGGRGWGCACQDSGVWVDMYVGLFVKSLLRNLKLCISKYFLKVQYFLRWTNNSSDVELYSSPTLQL